MRVVICHPPGGYPFMPYLAPYLLKGCVEQAWGAWGASGNHVVAHDLNIEYQLHLWSPSFARDAAERLARAGRRGMALVAELLAEQGRASWSALRDASTYRDHDALRRHVALLKEASAVSRELDGLRGAVDLLPARTGAWPDLLSRWEEATVGRFLAERLDAGLYRDADVVGIGAAYVQQILPALLLARALKARRPEVRIVLGGNAVTHYLPEVLADLSLWADIDFVIPFEGEASFVELLDGLRRETGPPDWNVAWRDGDAVRYRKDLGRRARVQPAVDFSDLEHLYPTPEPVYPLLTSKGCYWGRCAFCTHHEGYGEGYRPLADDRLATSLRELLARGARRFYFVDEALPPRMLADIAEVFARAASDCAADPPSWMAEARLERSFAAAPAVDLLARSGCRLLVNGIESGCQTVVDSMRKGIDLALAERHARQCREAGIRTGWMFFVGFPGETEAQAAETFAFIARNRAHLDFAAVGVFVLERGSPLWNDPRAWGVDRILEPERPYPMHFDYVMTDGTPVDFDSLAARRRRLFAAWPELRPLWTNALDRALVMFLPPAGAPGEDAQTSPVFTWYSPLAGAEVRIDLRTRRAEVQHAG